MFLFSKCYTQDETDNKHIIYLHAEFADSSIAPVLVNIRTSIYYPFYVFTKDTITFSNANKDQFIPVAVPSTTIDIGNAPSITVKHRDTIFFIIDVNKKK